MAVALAPAHLLALCTAVGVVGGLVVVLVRQADGPRGRSGGAARETLLGACVAGSAAGAVTGLVALLGAAAIPVLLVVALTSPWVVSAIGRRLGTVRSPSEAQLEAVVRALACLSPGFVPFQPLPQAQPATDEQLCQAWCASYRAMEATASRRRLMRIIEERGGYLDELERRNPAAFAAWLASGAIADANPLPYLMLAHLDHEAVNWDELTDGQDR